MEIEIEPEYVLKLYRIVTPGCAPETDKKEPIATFIGTEEILSHILFEETLRGLRKITLERIGD